MLVTYWTQRRWSRVFLRLFPPVLVSLLIMTAAAAGGEYVGKDVCGECHEDVVGSFDRTAHGRSDLNGWDPATACEACHGPGQQHVDEGGELELIVKAGEEGTRMCASCHGGGRTAHWAGSSHESFGVECASCHSVHSPWQDQKTLRNKDISTSCLECHGEMRKHMYQRSRHPLAEGLMSCVSCHNPHGSPAEAAVAAITPNDKCYECHADKRGPYLYEHQPVREDCGNCHSPHGSNQTMLLKVSPPRLCQSCHLFGHHQTVPGQPTQIWNQNRSCVNCHPRIHGSNHPSGVIFMR